MASVVKNDELAAFLLPDEAVDEIVELGLPQVFSCLGVQPGPLKLLAHGANVVDRCFQRAPGVGLVADQENAAASRAGIGASGHGLRIACLGVFLGGGQRAGKDAEGKEEKPRQPGEAVPPGEWNGAAGLGKMLVALGGDDCGHGFGHGRNRDSEGEGEGRQLRLPPGGGPDSSPDHAVNHAGYQRPVMLLAIAERMALPGGLLDLRQQGAEIVATGALQPLEKHHFGGDDLGAGGLQPGQGGSFVFRRA